jgi:hypothetical protein
MAEVKEVKIDFLYYKSITGVALIFALIVAFVNLLSIENAEMQLFDLFTHLK